MSFFNFIPQNCVYQKSERTEWALIRRLL